MREKFNKAFIIIILLSIIVQTTYCSNALNKNTISTIISNVKDTNKIDEPIGLTIKQIGNEISTTKNSPISSTAKATTARVGTANTQAVYFSPISTKITKTAPSTNSKSFSLTSKKFELKTTDKPAKPKATVNSSQLNATVNPSVLDIERNATQTVSLKKVEAITTTTAKCTTKKRTKSPTTSATVEYTKEKNTKPAITMKNVKSTTTTKITPQPTKLVLSKNTVDLKRTLSSRTSTTVMTVILPSSNLPSSLPSSSSLQSSCVFNGKNYKSSSTWIHNSQFNVTCDDGAIKVLNCITSLGTKLPLGTQDFVEKDGYHYDCKLRTKLEAHANDKSMDEESKVGLDFVAECDEGDSAYVRANFMVSCEREEILGCVDANGDLVRSGHYVLSGGRLRNCSVANDRRTADSQWRGCFNGTRDDDPDDEQLHVPLGHRWFNGEFVLECGAEGFFVHQCRIEGPRKDGGDGKLDSFFVETGHAWIDGENVFNVCQ